VDDPVRAVRTSPAPHEKVSRVVFRRGPADRFTGPRTGGSGSDGRRRRRSRCQRAARSAGKALGGVSERLPDLRRRVLLSQELPGSVGPVLDDEADSLEAKGLDDAVGDRPQLALVVGRAGNSLGATAGASVVLEASVAFEAVAGPGWRGETWCVRQQRPRRF
jgi:hypothetical protein